MFDDSLPSTHPIFADIRHTDEAEDLFDGISYGKGSSFVKQFHHLIGHETFSKGLHKYFNTFKGGNTKLTDYVGKMAEAYKEDNPSSELDLVKWCDLWLKTQGVNYVSYEVNESNNLEITHGKYNYCNELKDQKIRLSVFDNDFNETYHDFMLEAKEKQVV